MEEKKVHGDERQVKNQQQDAGGREKIEQSDPQGSGREPAGDQPNQSGCQPESDLPCTRRRLELPAEVETAGPAPLAPPALA